ncbi:hypothetical protein ACGFYA_20765 [Streptomyces sp. NPDC048305]|uniref:hypothetical protein n=1 Tax=Streptomyces sp. NPDC048305 TaxID=3365532 RepID=UPI00371A8A58
MIRELDELPDGTVIELLDRRGTVRFKRDGHWYAGDKILTQNTYTYVNTRRWGARVIEKGTE